MTDTRSIHVKMIAGAFSSLRNVSQLSLARCEFGSSCDLLRVLDAMRSLVEVDLVGVWWAHDGPFVPCRKPDKLSHISVRSATRCRPALQILMTPTNVIVSNTTSLSREMTCLVNIIETLYPLSGGYVFILRRSLYPNMCASADNILCPFSGHVVDFYVRRDPRGTNYWTSLPGISPSHCHPGIPHLSHTTSRQRKPDAAVSLCTLDSFPRCQRCHQSGKCRAYG